MNEKHVYLETYGCQMNVGDSRRLLGFLGEANYFETKDPSDADLILINTCSVRDKAEHKVYSALGKYRALKEDNPALKIAIAGCVAQQRGEALLKRLPYVDFVVGTQSIHRIARIMDEVTNGNTRLSDTAETPEIDPDEYGASLARSGDGKAFVNIMRGCDNFCSYCIVPHTRGREASRAPGEILREIEKLAGLGVKEITLLGQNVNSYGLKCGERTNEAVKVTFPELLMMVVQIEGIERVRFVTSHPKDISDELIELFAGEPKLCRHVHLPMQSGSDRILKAMNRGYDLADYSARYGKLKSLYGDMAITTDVIVGFPGETDEDFEHTMKAVAGLRFDNIFSFKYSRRPGTRAAEFDNQVPEDVRSARLGALLAVQREITFDQNKKFAGSTMKVLVEKRDESDSNVYTGRTACNRLVHFTGSGHEAGTIAEVFITEAHPNSLKGVCREGGTLC